MEKELDLFQEAEELEIGKLSSRMWLPFGNCVSCRVLIKCQMVLILACMIYLFLSAKIPESER